MKHTTTIVLIVLLTSWTGTPAQEAPEAPQALDIGGSWRFSLDGDDAGLKEQWFNRQLSESILLPGTTDIGGFGEPDPEVDKGYLLRDHKYIGPAWYQREILIPPSWKGKEVDLFLERCLWETMAWIDNRVGGTENSLTTPHRHALGVLEPGPHTLTLRVNNAPIVDVGTMSHSYTEETQSKWNGVVGRIELQAHDPVRFRSVKIYPNVRDGTVEIRFQIGNNTGAPAEAHVLQRIHEAGQRTKDTMIGIKVEVAPEGGEFSMVLEPEPPFACWDEFNPVLYELEAVLESANSVDRVTETFGFREILRRGRHMEINGRTIQLRGNVECCVFPETGHPPTDVESWLRIFRTMKRYGMNHLRYHTWCPPEAAFIAADRVGMYLQPETPLWVDGWMNGQLFGKDPDLVAFIRAEVNRILDAYGNHPSFCMFSLGNELHRDSDYEEMQRIINAARVKDPRRLYAICTARELTPSDDYYVSHAAPGGTTRGLGQAGTDWDFSKAVQSVEVPLISHETGQRPVFPDYASFAKYTGPLKPRNMAPFRDQLAAQGMLEWNRDFTLASERWALAQYRHEIEAILRTPDYCGFQLLQLNDFTGQGEALVGLLDPFWDPKGEVKPERFRKCCDATVPLLRFEKFLWTPQETFTAEALVSHFGPVDLEAVDAEWALFDLKGNELAAGSLGGHDIRTGGLHPLGSFELSLDLVKGTGRYRVALMLTEQGSSRGPILNAWDLWIFAETERPGGDLHRTRSYIDPKADVLVARSYDETVRAALARGGKVLLNPLNTKNDYVHPGNFFSLYWSAKWFPNQGGTLGLWCDPDHPALNGFPTSYHTDWQWKPLVDGSKVFVLDDAPKGYRPIVQPVSDFHLNHKLGSLFETRVGKGKLMVCGLNIIADHPAAWTMQKSLLGYMATDAFDPDSEIPGELLDRLFSEGPPPHTIPGEALNVLLAGNLPQLNRNLPWKGSYDRIITAADGYNVTLEEGGTWMDALGAAWHGNPLKIVVQVPEGTAGSLHLHLHDWNRLGRRGTVEVDGERQDLGDHTGDGKWLVFEIKEEDARDGRLTAACTPSRGPNLMVTQVIFKPGL